MDSVWWCLSQGCWQRFGGGEVILGGIVSVVQTNIFGGGSDAILANGSQASHLCPRGVTWSLAALEVIMVVQIFRWVVSS